jgi:hypothetical protein
MTKSSPRSSVAPAFAVADLPETGTQFRLTSGGTGTAQATAYLQALRALAAWAKPAGHGPLVHALVHLGWTSGSGARAICRAASSAAWKNGGSHLEAGAPAAPQVVATMLALKEAGAPAEHLDTVWATFTGAAA